MLPSIYLDEKSNAVQPDLTILMDGNKAVLEENGHLHGVPDVLVEILSPHNKEHDLIRKRALYERFRVGEYWIVDPDSKLALVYHLKNDRYELTSQQIGEIPSVLLNIHLTF